MWDAQMRRRLLTPPSEVFGRDPGAYRQGARCEIRKCPRPHKRHLWGPVAQQWVRVDRNAERQAQEGGEGSTGGSPRKSQDGFCRASRWPRLSSLGEHGEHRGTLGYYVAELS